MEGARRERWGAGLSEAPSPSLPEPPSERPRAPTPPDLPDKPPAVLLPPLVLRTLRGLFCLSWLWLLETPALVPCLARSVPQKFPGDGSVGHIGSSSAEQDTVCKQL